LNPELRTDSRKIMADKKQAIPSVKQSAAVAIAGLTERLGHSIAKAMITASRKANRCSVGLVLDARCFAVALRIGVSPFGVINPESDESSGWDLGRSYLCCRI
jgi:hypothetical protein